MKRYKTNIFITLIFFSFYANIIVAGNGMIFSDTFETDSLGKWQDMKVWGFAMWQIKDGIFIASTEESGFDGIFTAAPRLDNSILNRDYSMLFRLNPVAGGEYLFSIGFRQNGWSNYKFEITKEGSIQFIKSVIGKLPLTLFRSDQPLVEFGEWQWLRLTVAGEAPLIMKVKKWKGEGDDEPDSCAATVIDRTPLKPSNLSLSISSIQSGGAHTMLDEFHLLRLQPGYKNRESAFAIPEPQDAFLEAVCDSSAISSETCEKLAVELHALKTEFQTIGDSLHACDQANIDIMIFTAERFLDDCRQAGFSALLETQIKEKIDSARTALSRPQPFHHKTGSHLRGYYSDIDGSLQGYALLVPEKYDATRPYPLVVNLHGYDPGFSAWWENPFLAAFNPHAYIHDEFIFVNPFGRGNALYQDIGEHDVLHVMEEVHRLYNIDPGRVYLTGGSMGGGGTWHIGLSFPDSFAAIAPIMGPTEYIFWASPYAREMNAIRKFTLDRKSSLSYAENALHLPIYCNHGAMDQIVPVEQSRKMVQRLSKLGYDIKYTEHPGAEHGGFDPEMEDGIFTWFDSFQRNPHPTRVVHKAGSLKYGSSYWISILGFINQLKFATMDAEIKATNAIHVRTANVSQFSLTFHPELFDMNAVVQVHIDNSSPIELSIPDSRCMIFHAEVNQDEIIRQWGIASSRNEKGMIKNAAICGPISEAFNSAFVLVYGNSGNDEENKTNLNEAHRFSKQWHSWQHVYPRMKSDLEVTESDVRQYNLILFGGPKCNAITSELMTHLPIRFENEKIIAGKHVFPGENAGVAMVYPNPRCKDRYIVLYAGVTWQGTTGIVKRMGSEFDYVIFDDKTMGINALQGNLTIDGTPLLYGFFDQNWRLTGKYQLTSDKDIRSGIVSRRVAQASSSEDKNNAVYISDLEILDSNQLLGAIEIDRSFWGQALVVDGQRYEKGLGIFPNSELIYELDDEWSAFSAIVKADINPYGDLKKWEYTGGKIQFGIYGDNCELFLSNIMDVNSTPQNIFVNIKGFSKLRLVVRTQDWLPYFAQSASWIDAKLSK